MRNFQTLNQFENDQDTGILYISARDDNNMQPRISMRREGSYIAISASYGPLEIAMRLHIQEFARVLSRLRPVQGLQTTRNIGTGQAYISVGLQEDHGLVMRPTIIGDATGHICLNLILANNVREALHQWLPVPDLRTPQ
jgi:hypothetical protein